MSRRIRAGLLLGVFLGASLSWFSVAHARKQTELRYPFEQVWNTALRMVRVDLRFPVTDRDPEAGFMLFDYLDHGKRYPGSIELVKSARDQRPIVTAVVQVPGMPAYVEQMLLDKLEQKLRDELGEPPTPTKPEPEKPEKPREPEKRPGRDERPPEDEGEEQPQPEPDPG